jgi:hypothetical protein
MEVGTSLEEDFGQCHFGSARLGDARRTRRLVKVAQTLIENPSGTLPRRVRGHAELTALYRLLDAGGVTHESVLSPHRERTLALMRQTPVVLILHDSTELDYTSRRSLKELGQIGNGGGRGYVCHNSLAVTPQREVIGLANQVLHTRRRVPAGESPAAKRAHPGRESRLWPGACGAIGPAPRGVLWVDVADAGADTFEFAAYELHNGRHFVIRSARDRNLAGEDHVGADRVYRKLYAYTRDLPDLGAREVAVAAVPGKSKARTASVRVAGGPVSIAAPHFVRGELPGGERSPHLDLSVVHVREVEASAPAGATPLSDLPADTFAGAGRCTDYYGCRPMVEEFHKGKKTGCQIEAAQLESEERLEPLIALLSVVSVVLLQLRQLARDPEARDTPADAVVPELCVRVLSAWRNGRPGPMSVLEFCLALARLGGHQNRKCDGFPGWLTLWRGWADLQLMVKGVTALHGEDV